MEAEQAAAHERVLEEHRAGMSAEQRGMEEKHAETLKQREAEADAQLAEAQAEHKAALVTAAEDQVRQQEAHAEVLRARNAAVKFDRAMAKQRLSAEKRRQAKLKAEHEEQLEEAERARLEAMAAAATVAADLQRKEQLHEEVVRAKQAEWDKAVATHQAQLSAGQREQEELLLAQDAQGST